MPGNRKHHTDAFRSCVEQVMAKGESEASAYAICTTSLQKAGTPIFEAAEENPMNDLRSLHLLGATGRARTEMLNGKEYLVVPVVALMEGVIHAVNAETPERVPLATLEKAARSWDGKPLTLGHPKKGGKQCSAQDSAVIAEHGLGIVRNSRVQGKKLLQEAWIEKQRAQQLHPTMYKDLEEGRSVEVSVGAYVVTDGVPGEMHGKRFMASWVEASGDHLAFLPGGRGACSIEMGCGAHRAAMHFVTAEAIEWEGTMGSHVGAFFRSLMPRGWGDDEVKQDLRDVLYGIEPPAKNGEILRVTNNEIVYCVYPPPMPPVNVYDQYPSLWPSKMTYWKRPYTFDTATRTFTLGEKAQVEPTTVYEVLKGLTGKPAYKDCPMCDGSGSKDGNPCEACDGNGETKVIKAAEVVPPQVPPDLNAMAHAAYMEALMEFRALWPDKNGFDDHGRGPGSGGEGEQNDDIMTGKRASGGDGLTAEDRKQLDREIEEEDRKHPEFSGKLDPNRDFDDAMRRYEIQKAKDKAILGAEPDLLVKRKVNYRKPENIMKSIHKITGYEGNAPLIQADDTTTTAAGKPQLRAAGCGCKDGNPCGCKGEGYMADKATRAELIAALTTDQFSGFEPGDTALLEAASDVRLAEFRAAAEERKTEAAAFVRLENEFRNTNARLKVSEERLRTAQEPMSEEEFLAKAPAKIKAVLDTLAAEEATYRGSMIVQLKDLGAHSEDQLKAMTTEHLESLAKYARITVPDFSGRALPVQRAASASNDYAPPNPYASAMKQKTAVN